MKIKLFEDFQLHDSSDIDYTDYDKLSYWAYSDKFLKIHKILNGVNKGKIQFRFFTEKKEMENEFSNICSTMFGASKLLGTKYVNMPEIREITTGPMKFRKVHRNTIESIMELFTQKIDYINYDNENENLKKILVNAAFLRFDEKIKEIGLESENLGEIFDRLKIISDEVYTFQEELFDKLQLDLHVNKYNL